MAPVRFWGARRCERPTDGIVTLATTLSGVNYERRTTRVSPPLRGSGSDALPLGTGGAASASGTVSAGSSASIRSSSAHNSAVVIRCTSKIARFDAGAGAYVAKSEKRLPFL